MRPVFIPRTALRLGLLSLLPLIVSGLFTLSAQYEVARIGGLSFAIYAAALLSFLGGARCGIEITRAPEAPNGMRLFFSILPALAGWALVLFVSLAPSLLGASSIFAGLFAAQYVWDHKSADAGAPDWYPLLRQVCTGGAMIACMLLPLANALGRI